MRVLLPLAAPVALVPVAGPLPSGASDDAAPAQEGRVASIMVVEDERSVREFVRTALSRAGYHVLAAEGGNEALAQAAAHDGVIDLLLTDVVMPGLSGRELALRFRAARPSARVLFMSGYAADVVAAEGTLAGDAELLVKPFTPHELVERVGASLQR
jgi:DNA-binding response OmpR family regulator